MSATITAVACKSCGGPVPAGFKEFCSRSCFSDHMKKGKADREARYAEFERLWSAAHSAGLAAALAATPPAMVVQRRSDPMDDTSPIEKEWIVPDGPCGFAWITVPGNSSFARWRKKVGTADRDYYGGCCIKNVHEFNQSLIRKTAYAIAFARVLQDAGIPAHAHDRID